MFKTIGKAFKVKDIRNKILLTLLLLFIYRIGCWLPVPGIDASVFNTGTQEGFLGLMNMISGGALQNASILALGVSPYITASIMIQLLTVAIPRLERLAKQGEEGRKKINLYTRITALILAVAQAVGIVISFSGSIDPNILWDGAPTWFAGTCITLILVAGGMFTVWVGERITDIGIGNGVSLLIFVGILGTAGTSILSAAEGVASDLNYLWNILIFAAAIVLIFGLIVLIDLAERKVPVQYAKQIKGRKMYGGQSSTIPIRVNSSGVMPIIFSSAFLAFPQLLITIFWPGATWYNEWLGAGSWIYIVLTAACILGFSFFYSKITFDPADVAKRIQQNGGFIPGIRPGRPTSDFLGRISNRITLFGAFFLAFIALVPSLVFKAIGGANSVLLVNAFSATGLMIVVSVALEFEKQLDAQMLMRTYKGFLK